MFTHNKMSAQGGYNPLFSNSSNVEEGDYTPTNPLPQENLNITVLSTHLDNLSFAPSVDGGPNPDSDSGMITPPQNPEILNIFGPGALMTTPARVRFLLPESPEQVSPTSSAGKSDVSDTDIRPGLVCPICDPRRQVRIAFKECSHGTCRSCAVSIWKARWEHDEYPPAWFPCPLCRTEVSHIGVLTDDADGNGEDGRYVFGQTAESSGVECMVRDWPSVHKWVADQREDARMAVLVFEEAIGRGRETLTEDEVSWVGGSSPPNGGFP